MHCNKNGALTMNVSGTFASTRMAPAAELILFSLLANPTCIVFLTLDAPDTPNRTMSVSGLFIFATSRMVSRPRLAA